MKTASFAFAPAGAITLPVASHAATIRVPADAASIQQAIDAAVGGDTVLVSPGTYTITIACTDLSGNQSTQTATVTVPR